MRVLSGIQPSGRLHIGNYFGAIKQHIELQKNNECYYFIADYHALTTIKDARLLKDNIANVALDYYALGLDSAKTVFFKQSDVPQVTELAWILSTLAPLGLLERCHSYKDKIAHGITPHLGVFSYPVLMASDILIYKPDLVPVGKDQKQHIEVTRDLATKFNCTYKKYFKLPNEHILPHYAIIPGIDGQKMSKSYKNTIDIFAEENQLKKRVMSIKTDSTPIAEPKDPSQCTVYNLYSLFATSEEKDDMAKRYREGGTGYKDFKEALLKKITTYFSPYYEKRRELSEDPRYIHALLEEGAEKARQVAIKTLQEIKKIIGIL
ncbi:MAG: tryptophan--tRNA ligase [Candidatus Ancaeobacter aquaticus]|nr:tryptophan--tRNA ligase [Candidatus Ancaeobacter aquaticus]